MDGFLELKPRDYKAYEGYFANEGNEPFSMYLHMPCGQIIGHQETHLRYCPAVIAVVSPSVMGTPG